MNQQEIKTPTQKELLEIFEEIKQSKYEDVQGVIKFDSGKPGPTLGITIQTHGNEPSGLATLWYFLNVFPLQKVLQKGSVFFVINNINATEKYLYGKSDEDKRKARFIDTNFNRLPENVMACDNSANYEVCRAQELKKIWGYFDVGLDIHSTTQDSEPMIIAINKFEKELVEGFPIKVIISNIENIQIGIPPTVFYGGKKSIPVVCIESGSHEKSDSFNTAITCALNLMQNINIIPKNTVATTKREYILYKVVDSLVFPNDSYLLNKIYTMFETVSKGDIVANGDEGPIHAPVSGCAIFGPKQIKPDSIDEEVLFFTEPSKTLLQKTL